MQIMSSSISSSDRDEASGESWRRFAVAAVAGAAAVLLAVLGSAYAIDPYDTGRSSLFEKPGVRPQGPRTAGASRGRDPAFDAAIFGNSHVQLLSPERLRASTGLPFVQLSVPATGPKEQLVMIDWFLRHHREPRVLVIGADERWCTSDPELPNDKPFPFWLYARGRLEYLRGLLRYDILEELPRRIGYVLSARARRASADGYWDYEPAYGDLGYASDPKLRARLAQRVENYVGNATGRFPAAARLRALVAGLPPDLAVVLVFPPVYATALPSPGSPGAAADRACKSALAEAVAGHRRAAVVDWRVDRPEAHNADWFFDHTHYRQPIAMLVEKDIAGAVAGARAKAAR